MTDNSQEMTKISQQIWNTLAPYTENSDDVMMAAAVVLKTSIQLYSCVMNDEDIENMLSGFICDNIPQIRAQFEKKLHTQIH